MGKAFKTRGVILKRMNLGEADKLLTLFSPTHGKMVVLAKGIRKIHSRKAPHLELLNDVHIFVTVGKMSIVTEAETHKTYSYLRTQLQRVAYAYKIVELVDRLCAEGEVHSAIFHLLVAVLSKLNDKQVKNFEAVTEKFAVQLLWELGYLPKENVITGTALTRFLETVMERSLKSDNLLTRLSGGVVL